MNFNARILVKNHENICHILAATEHRFSVTSITKTWIRSSDYSELNLPGYQVSNHRSDRAGGGVGMYIDQDLSFKILKEHNSHDTSIFESLFAEICSNNVQNVVAGVIYRPPSENTLTRLEKFDELLSKLTRKEKTYYICGDFNLDLLQFENNSTTAQIVESVIFCLLFVTNNKTDVSLSILQL